MMKVVMGRGGTNTCMIGGVSDKRLDHERVCVICCILTKLYCFLLFVFFLLCLTLNGAKIKCFIMQVLSAIVKQRVVGCPRIM